MSVYFANANTGYAAGYNMTILKTTNGGSSWTIVNSGTQGGLNCVYFTDANTGYASGGYLDVFLNIWGIILRTTDGGLSWIPVNSGNFSWLYSVHFPESNTGYSVGLYGTIIKTTDG